MTVECDICHKSFISPSHLKKHHERSTPCANDNTHEKNQQCEKCSKKFRFSSALSRHRKICQGPRMTKEEVIADLKHQLQQAKDELAVNRSEFVQEAVVQETIESCGVGAVGDVFKPTLYFGKPGSLLIPEVPTSGQLVKFGQSHDVSERITKAHMPDFGGFILLDCVVSINPVLIEKRFKKLLDVQGKRIKCKTANKSYKDTEVFVVHTQDEYDEIVRQCKSLADEHEEELLGINRAVIAAASAENELKIRNLTLQLELLQQ